MTFADWSLDAIDIGSKRELGGISGARARAIPFGSRKIWVDDDLKNNSNT